MDPLLVGRAGAISLAFFIAISSSSANDKVAAHASATTTAADRDAAGDRSTTEAAAMCIDQEIANRLSLRRRKRKNIDRLFVKQARHELSAVGGYYASDLFSATFVAGGSYTYHMTDDIGVEFGGAYSKSNADIIRTLENGRGVTIANPQDSVVMAEAMLVWSPIYGKMRLGGTVLRFDMHLDGGVGVVDTDTSRGISGVGGIGFKLLFPEAFALRIDIRDHVFRQELLDQGFLVNDLSATLGFSLFLPLGN